MFRSNMTPPEIAAMIESLYRVRGGAVDFRTLSLQPRPFLGTNGFQLDYEHLDDDELWRQGRVVGAVINGQLYLILLDAARVALLRRGAARFRSRRRLGRVGSLALRLKEHHPCLKDAVARCRRIRRISKPQARQQSPARREIV